MFSNSNDIVETSFEIVDRANTLITLTRCNGVEVSIVCESASVSVHTAITKSGLLRQLVNDGVLPYFVPVYTMRIRGNHVRVDGLTERLDDIATRFA